MRILYLIHSICIYAALALISPAALSQPNAVELKAAVDAAWQRSPQARALVARRDEMQAGHDAARTWIAGAPTIGLSQRSDRWTERNGERETDVSLSAPVWLPAQKSARETLARTSADTLEAQIAEAKLALAGEVRERFWAVAGAREALLEATDHQHHLEEIAEEVMRRVKAGDLAKVDGLLARQEVLAAQASVSAAQAKVQEALARYQTLTGQQDIPVPQPEPVANAMQEPHPRIVAARAVLQRSAASLEVVNRTRSDPPTVGVSLRQEKDRPATPASRSITLGVQIPIGTAARNRVQETAARTQIETASAEVTQVEATVRADTALAREQLATADQALEAAAMRADLMREHTRLIEKAFRLGERGLADLLRSKALSHEAEVGERQQRVAVGLARARLNQALGVMP